MIQTANDTAFTDIVNRYTPVVLARCERELGRSDADDAVQAVFLVLWRRQRDISLHGAALTSWLYRTTGFVVRRVRRDRVRRRRLHEQAPRSEETTMDGPGPSETLEVRRVLDSALGTLPTVEREAVVLSQLAGHDYAEIAVHLCCSKATVARHVQQGLQTLRRMLERRGCVLSLAALAALLSAEAQASVPLSLAERINRLPAASTTGTTAGVLSANIIRWSRSEMSVMKIIGTTSAALLCAAGLYMWSASTAKPFAAEPTSAIATETDEIEQAMEALRVQSAYCVRWIDPCDTWKRMRATPLGALIPLEKAQEIEDQLSGIKRIDLVFDPMAELSLETDSDLARKVRRRQAIALIKGTEEAKRLAQEEAKKEQEEFQEAIATQDVVKISQANNMVKRSIGGKLPGYYTSIKVLCSDSAASLRCRTWLAQQLSDLTQQTTNSGFTISGTRADLAVAVTDNSLSLDIRPDDNEKDFSWANSIPWPSGRDVQCRVLQKPRHPAAYAKLMHIPAQDISSSGDLNLWIEDGHVRMLLDFAATSASNEWSDLYSKCSSLSATAWDRIPPGALAAAAISARPDDKISIAVIDAVLSLGAWPLFVMNRTADAGGHQELLGAIHGISAVADGNMISYIEPTGLIPALTVALSAPTEHCSAMFSVLADKFHLQLTEASTFQFTFTYCTLEIGHRDGYLVATTHPAGISSFALHEGQFAAEADVESGLAATGADPALARVIVRTDKIIETALPMAAAIGLPPEQTADLQSAAAQLREHRDGGWFVMRMHPEGMRAEAGGAAAMIAAIALAAKSGLMPSGIN
jgi:RNA polymerase sigma-70 factor, ECF subfamily